MIDAWERNYTVIKMAAGDDDIILSTLPPETKKRLWANIKTRNPAKAEAMLDALNAVRQLDPTAELTLTKTEIEEYLK